MKLALCVVLGYILGSIPFALVIGKVFYHTDVREYGSGNLGGTNAGRVLGKKVGIAVIALDALKVVLAMGLSTLISPTASIWAGLACCVGHCYPCFAHFKGGKAVASTFGFLLATWLFVFGQPMYFFIPLCMFIIVLFLFKFVSLASMCAVISSSLYIFGTITTWDVSHILILIASCLTTILVVYRHRSNITKIKEGNENKISWL